MSQPVKKDRPAVESILIVEDNQDDMQLLVQTLETGGFRLLTAENGEKAIEKVKSGQPDLIMMDITMPEIDGVEACRRLKEDPSTRDIPVIFISGLDETTDKVKGLDLGAVDYVSKPFEPLEVLARVRTHLNVYRLDREVKSKKDQLEHELHMVSRIQYDLLPRNLPDMEGIKLGAHYRTSRYAGGDYYDVVELPGKKLGIMMADAEGHSAPATVRMAMTCVLFRACYESHDAPGPVLDSINEHLLKVSENSFITAIYAIYDTSDRTMRIARAGHPMPLLRKSADRQVVELQCEGVFPFGWQSYDSVPETEIRFQPGDQILFYTDGITDRFNPETQRFGKERLINLFQLSADGKPQVTVESITTELDRFAEGRPTDDDQTFLVFAMD